MKWHDLPVNPAADAEPPAIPTHTPAALTPEQVGMLLAAVQQDRRLWLRLFTILAAATGARSGELCGLEWHDLDLDDGTLQFRQALSTIDQQLATGQPRPDGIRGKLLVVRLKGAQRHSCSSLVPRMPCAVVLRGANPMSRENPPAR
jgi:integrase